jgi:hypothetical protein
MKEIFIGSSKEAVPHAKEVAILLNEIDNVKPVLWTEYFGVGDITFLSIENLSKRITAAVFLATPDDDSVIREQHVKTPRANVLFEYGYLTASLTRRRVALCRYANVELPSDFAGVTYVPMGEFDPNHPIETHAKTRLKTWAAELPAVQVGCPSTHQLHGYSGLWQNESVYRVWRRLIINKPDYAVFRGKMLLHIPSNGESGQGCVYGNLQVQIGTCYAEFEVTDKILDARVLPDGGMTLRSAMQSRQRIRLEGEPPQRDGFEPDLRGAREFDSVIYCPKGEAGVLRGRYSTRIGDDIYSDADELYQYSG